MSAYPPQYGSAIGPYSTAIASLNPNTLVIVNADIAQSLTDAQTYCDARGIPRANIRSVHFGSYNYPALLAGLQDPTKDAYLTVPGTTGGRITTAAAYNGIAAGSALLPMIANEITNYGALCVLFSTYTPCNYVGTNYGTGTQTNGAYCLPAVVAAAAVTSTIAALYTNTALGSYTLPGVGLAPSLSLAAFANNFVPVNWATLTTLRPHGRIGCPDLTQMNTAPYNLAELPLGIVVPSGSPTTVFGNALANALAAGASNQTALPVYYSSSDEPAYGSTAQAPAYAALVAQQAFAGSVDMGSQITAGTLGYKFKNTNPCASPLPIFGCALLLGGLNSTGAQAGQYQYTAGVNCPWNSNFTTQPGAFGGCYASYSYNFGMSLLYNGASAAVMTVAEPYAQNIAFGSEIFNVLVNQRAPLALALFWSPAGGGSGNLSNTAIIGQTVFGDPLYQPFKNTFPPGYGALPRGILAGGGAVGVS